MRPPDDPLTALRAWWRQQRYHGRHHRADHLVTARRRRPAAVVLVFVIFAAISGTAAPRLADDSETKATAGAIAEISGNATAYLERRTDAAQAASRTAARSAAATSRPVPPAQAVAPEERPEPPAEPGTPRTGTPPVGGLSQRQMDHAATIVAMGQRAGLPERAYVVAIATALQESNLRNLANPRLPQSLDLAHDGTGNDHDSVGLFQQRTSTGWGPVPNLMDPAYAATKFYDALVQVPGWEDLPVTVAAQSVQRSAFPGHYAKHEPLAREIVAALTD